MSFRRSASQFFSPNHHPTVVIKVGTSSLIRAEQGSLNLSSLASIVETARDLKALGFNVIIVSSGAVGVGCQRLRLCTRPDNLAQKQALAAVGQVHLMRYYDDLFSALDLKCAQVLLTLDNLANRSQYINAKNTFEELLRLGAIPIVNENDTVAVQELRIGDNDTLSAQVATLVQAEWLFLLTDVPNLFTANPNTDPDAQPIYEVADLSKLNVDTSTKGTQWGTGGMATKLTAARIATAAGCRMVICSAVDPSNIPKIIAGERIGTVFHPNVQPLKGRKRWILSVPVRGELWLDSGAQAAVQERKKSLFSAGIIKVEGEFEAQDAVRLCDEQGSEFARALINYSSHEVDKVKGMNSKEFAAGLGYMGQEEVCHRANICLLLISHDDSENDHTSEPHSPYDPSRTPTTPVALMGQHAAAIAAAVAEVEAARAAGQDAGVRFQLPPRPPHHAGSSGSLGGANGNGHPQQADQEQQVQQAEQEQQVQQAEQQQQQGTTADDIVARLAVLRTRGGGQGAMAGRGQEEGEDWTAQLAAAVAAEQLQEASVPAAASGEDIDENGWLPK